MPNVQSKHLAAYDQAEEARCRLRLTAVQCWWESKCDIRAAVALLKQRTPGVRHTNPARFIRIWVAAMEQRFSVATPSSPGRKSTIPAAAAERAVELVWQGFESEGQHRYFRSIQQALSRCRELAAIQKKYGVSAKTLLRHMAAVEPALRRRRLAVKRQLSDENRLARQEACRRLLLWPAEQLRRVFWIDAATIYVVPKSRLVYAPPHAHMVVTDARLPSHSTNLLKLKFYICINAVAGAVELKFVTGTTDLEGDEEWLTTRGTPAKGCTNQEWESVMVEFKAAIAAVLASDKWRAAVGRGGAIFSFDNDKIHQNRLTLAFLKINAHNRFPLPPNSPDMHRVVERCVGRLKEAFQDWLHDHPAPRSAAEYQDELVKLFKTTQTASVISGDVGKLPSLWPFILKAKGGWPPKKEC